jgi:uncharacterized protein (DUF111 family)
MGAEATAQHLTDIDAGAFHELGVHQSIALIVGDYGHRTAVHVTQPSSQRSRQSTLART